MKYRRQKIEECEGWYFWTTPDNGTRVFNCLAAVYDAIDDAEHEQREAARLRYYYETRDDL